MSKRKHHRQAADLGKAEAPMSVSVSSVCQHRQYKPATCVSQLHNFSVNNYNLSCLQQRITMTIAAPSLLGNKSKILVSINSVDIDYNVT